MQKNIKFKTRGAYLSEELRQKFSKNPDSFFLEINTLDENIKLIEKFFSKILGEHGDELDSRKAFLKFMKVNSGLRAWDILTWGEKELLGRG